MKFVHYLAIVAVLVVAGVGIKAVVADDKDATSKNSDTADTDDTEVAATFCDGLFEGSIPEPWSVAEQSGEQVGDDPKTQQACELRFNDGYLLTVSTVEGSPIAVDQYWNESVSASGYFEVVRDEALKTADDRTVLVKANAFTDASDKEVGATLYFIRLSDESAIAIGGDATTTNPDAKAVDALVSNLKVSTN